MKVGFLGFGEVAAAFTNWLNHSGVYICTSLENRSIKTVNRARKMGVEVFESNRELAETSDFLISSVTPLQSIDIAKEVGKYVNGIYVDVNNISPQTAIEALGYVENGKTVDAAIMGGVKKEGSSVVITASGRCALKFTKLNEYGLNIKALGPELGKAKTLKMLRSQYTKGVSALLIETLINAYNLGLYDDLLKYLELTEGSGFCKLAVSRINSSTIHAKRKAEEMDEILKFIKDSDSTEGLTLHEMVTAAREVFLQIKNNSDNKEIPTDYGDVLEFLKNK